MIRQSTNLGRRIDAGRLTLHAIVMLVACVASLLAAASYAQSNPSAPVTVFSPGFRFVEPDGESLYRNVCSACHMMDGKGASGAGVFPSLANDKRLEAAGYPLYVVTNGLHGMPPLGMFMSDEQVAAVVNYVRTHFGNDYQDAVTAADPRPRDIEPVGAVIARSVSDEPIQKAPSTMILDCFGSLAMTKQSHGMFIPSCRPPAAASASGRHHRTHHHLPTRRTGPVAPGSAALRTSRGRRQRCR